MSGAKRLAKRSIVGTRVSALSHQDGRYHPGVIRAVAAEATPATEDLFTIVFDDGSETNATGKNIVGSGFLSGPTGRLKHGQKVFITLNGREVCGSVAHHDRRTDEVIITVKQPSGDELTLHRKVEDVRLLESRKSARLQDHSTDYSKLADRHRSAGDHHHYSHNNNKRSRVVSHSIAVPSTDSKQRKRRSSSSGETTESMTTTTMTTECGGSAGGVEGGGGGEGGIMDEKVAALVLTSLSVSPQSPKFMSSMQGSGYDSIREHSYVSTSVTSSGFYSGQSSEGGDPSPPHSHLSESAPASFEFEGRADLSSDSDTRESVPQSDLKKEGSGVKYGCTWRGCSSVHQTTNGIKRHIRGQHLDMDSDIELSDGEEDFYYEEIDEDGLMDSVTESFAGMMYASSRSSPPADCRLAASYESPSAFDHDYMRKEERSPLHHGQASSVPSGGAVFDFSDTSTSAPSATSSTSMSSIPICIPEGQIKRSLSWQVHPQSPGTVVSPPPHNRSPLKPSASERLQQHQAQSPKTHMLSSLSNSHHHHHHHRRARSEVRKCRKVYGMDHRDQWCTQCKWKKACTRFID